METIIVSRHEATITFLQDHYTFGCPVIRDNVTSADVAGKRVYGNLPMHLAAMCGEYWAVELPDNCPRGQELDVNYLADNAKVVRYYLTSSAPFDSEKDVSLLEEEIRMLKEVLFDLMYKNQIIKKGNWSFRRDQGRNFSGITSWKGELDPEEAALLLFKTELGL